MINCRCLLILHTLSVFLFVLDSGLWGDGLAYASSNQRDQQPLKSRVVSSASLHEPITTLLSHEILEYSHSEMIKSYQRTPLLRLAETMSHLKIDPMNKLKLAYIEGRSGQLKIVHLKKKIILTVDGPGIGQSFSWTPDGSRILFRKQVKRNGSPQGTLAIYDINTNRSYPIETMNFFSGIPTLDPRSQEFLILHPKGISKKKIHLPEARLARWQKSRGDHHGMFAVTPKAVMHISADHRGVHKLSDDGSGVQSYAITHDGSKIVWATHDNKVYMATDHWDHQDTQGQLIGYGLDPSWSDDGQWVIFAGARTVGQTISGYDLRKVNLKGEGIWLTKTFHIEERWPVFLRDGSILFTIEKTTDLFALEPKHQNPSLKTIVHSFQTSDLTHPNP